MVLPPVMEDNLKKTISASPFNSIMFDESLNHTYQECQMDLQIRLWEEDEGRAVTRYLDSKFLYRPNADNLSSLINKAASTIDQTKTICLLMDGPSVNFCVLEKINTKRKKNDLAELYNIGCCSLHSVHLGLKAGSKAVNGTWQINKVLAAMFNLFRDSPARR